MASRQLALDLKETMYLALSPELTAAVNEMSTAGTESRGEIFTRTEVVEFILNLVGYTSQKPLYKSRILEPSFGSGSFLIPIVKRLLISWKKDFGKPGMMAINNLANAVRAVELHRETFESTYLALEQLLQEEGFATRTAHALLDQWLFQGDFLLTPFKQQFEFVVGNPPYVRQELISTPLIAEYRKRYSTVFDRADLYIPFIERSLSLISKRGCLGFICSDRWMKNRYGGPLRKLVAEQFHLRTYVDMFETHAFGSQVSAYPAIFIISRETSGPTRIAHRPAINQETLAHLADTLTSDSLSIDSKTVRDLSQVTNGAEPWLLESSDQVAIIRRLEQQYPNLEEAGCKVGIGVATGADKEFIGDFDTLDVEPDRKLPLVTTKDIISGEVRWRRHGVINPFEDDGSLVELQDYPRLRQYLEVRRDKIAARHCAQKSPAQWYRTIDRIIPSLAKKPKLLIPDIKGQAHVVFESGMLYPHHNLYYVTSAQWELRALQAVLLSAVTRLFIMTYATKMRGGYLRFQAQYLRRIRIPYWEHVPKSLREELVEAAIKRDISMSNMAVYKLYNLTKEERSALGGHEE